MLAHRRADVDDLNRRARDLLLAAGALAGPTVYGADQRENPRCFAVGDQVVVRRNDHRHGLVNGQRGVVTAVDPHTGSLRITAAGRGLTVSRAHLMAGALDHGYALTVHQAQGLTVDRALLLGSTGLYREAGYVGLSRARDRTDLILCERPGRPRAHRRRHRPATTRRPQLPSQRWRPSTAPWSGPAPSAPPTTSADSPRVSPRGAACRHGRRAGSPPPPANGAPAAKARPGAATGLTSKDRSRDAAAGQGPPADAETPRPHRTKTRHPADAEAAPQATPESNRAAPRAASARIPPRRERRHTICARRSGIAELESLDVRGAGYRPGLESGGMWGRPTLSGTDRLRWPERGAETAEQETPHPLEPRARSMLPA